MKTQTLSLPRQIIDNENNFLNATLKVISRNQQWLHYHYHIFLILIEIISNKTVNVIQASTPYYLLLTTNYLLHFKTVAPHEYPTPNPAINTSPCKRPSFRASHKAMGIVEDTVFPTFSRKK